MNLDNNIENFINASQKPHAYFVWGTIGGLFSIGKLLYCKFNGNNKVSEVTQQDIAQLPSEYTLNSSIGVYRSVLVNARNTGSLQIDTYGKITLYCPYSYLYGYVIIPIK